MHRDVFLGFRFPASPHLFIGSKAADVEELISGVRDIGAYNVATGSHLEHASKIC